MVVHDFTTEPVAIVGSSCRFPGGSSTPSKLWELLEKPRDVLKEIPTSRFNVDGFYHEDGEHHGVFATDSYQDHRALSADF